MDEHQKFLADRLLSEQRPITYRNLSRSLNVHVNTAKSMLFQFHQSQQKNSTIRATYLICGTLEPSDLMKDEHENKESLSQTDDLLHVAKESTVTLAGEDRLQQALNSYESVTSIHIYGLSPKTPGNSWSQEVQSPRCGNKDSAIVDKHGAIYNPSVRLRASKSIISLVSSSHIVPTKSSAEQADTAKKLPLQSSTPNDRPRSNTRETGLATATGRMASGSIFQSFAKAVPKSHIKAAEPAQQENGADMALSDDGDADDSDILPIKSQSQSRSEAKTRTQREELLRHMMEEEDDSEQSDVEEVSAVNQQAEGKVGPEAGAEAGQKPGISAGDAPSEIISGVDNGRRRGKRRVVQKKRILDEQGYMVTIQEPGWESFSEDDTGQPPIKKPTLASTPSSSAKSKKSSGKGAQGSIMAFFNKK
ncbi:hypothetical protein C2857_001733 [Epichloe festucae Fl1]|uniref:DNA polymerase delta subunit 3 n=1 Tax=Epichloe festucae (strain Fl1) TaxID=877507 RepID=A0A7S9PWF8_EPIFF|nr:hypothetical protein C2857_001733 [Epichloe festucae Fl1]